MGDLKAKSEEIGPKGYFSGQFFVPSETNFQIFEIQKKKIKFLKIWKNVKKESNFFKIKGGLKIQVFKDVTYVQTLSKMIYAIKQHLN